MSSEHNVKHLWNCALGLDVETRSKMLLKSYLINVCRRVASSSDSGPAECFTASQMCKRCSRHWHENEFQMKLKPQTLHLKTCKARQLVDKLNAQKRGKDKGLLTKKQKKRAKLLLKHSESKVEINCDFCHHKTYMALDKPIKVKCPTKDFQKSRPTETAKSQKKKKKTTINDSKAGLKIREVKKVETLEKSLAMNMKKIENKVLKSTKPKKKNAKKKEPLKIQSKTQKQNSLLQLATLLKSQNQNKKSSVSRLESFME